MVDHLHHAVVHLKLDPRRGEPTRLVVVLPDEQRVERSQAGLLVGANVVRRRFLAFPSGRTRRAR